MVITHILGGIGNQMFQYAAGYALAKKLGTECVLDTTEFSNYSLRIFSLGHFDLKARTATRAEVAPFAQRGIGWLSFVILRKLGLVKKRKVKGLFEDASLNYNPELLKQEGELIYLRGYWQSETYFADVAGDIRKQFVVNTAPSGKNAEALSAIQATDSVCLHIRRGDYVQNQHTNSVHGVASLEYYAKAFEHVAKSVPKLELFVFSDDIAWARENLKLNAPMHFMDQNGPEQDFEDMRLMSNCKHHIIANSTFSWWGAWLAERPGQIVVAPKNWFNDGRPEQIVPTRWKRF